MKLTLLIGLTIVLLKLQLTSAGFKILKAINETSHTGVLVISTNGATGTVCTESTTSADITPSDKTANHVCREVRNSENSEFQKLEWVGNAGHLFNWARKIPILFADLTLVCDKNNSCKYNLNTTIKCKEHPSGNRVYYITTISCGCNSGYYRTDAGCYKCGNNTFSVDNNTSCTPCPEGTSTAGIQDAKSRDQCKVVCNTDQVKISGRCVSNLTVALGCGVAAVVVAVLFLLWCLYKKYRAVVRMRIRETRNKQAQARQDRYSRGVTGSGVTGSNVGYDPDLALTLDRATIRANHHVTESEGSESAKSAVKSPTRRKGVVSVGGIVEERRDNSL